jgi:hypothetical protein
MAFQCPQCGARSGLEITCSLSLRPDNRSDEICLQVVGCTGCGFSGLAVYEKSRRGPLDAEHWDHTGFRASSDLVHEVETAVRACKDPLNPDCPCAAHHMYNQVDAQGRWVNPAARKGAAEFAMIHYTTEEPV